MKNRFAGAGLMALALLPAGVAAQQKANHIAELGAAEKTAVVHVHALVHAPANMTKAAAEAHLKALDAALTQTEAHLAAIQKENTAANLKLTLAEIGRDQVSARTHYKALAAEVAKPKLDIAAVKKHAEGVDSAIDDAADLQGKLAPHVAAKKK
jgi:hypothetical protein